MNEKILWDDSFNTGIEEIDEQHQKAIKIANELHNAVVENADKNIIISLIEKLDFYVNSHFETEENYMEKYNFENILEHQKAHEYFKDTYEQIRYSYFYVGNKELPDYKLVNTYALHLSSILIDWLNFHLQTYDKDFLIFIRSKLKS